MAVGIGREGRGLVDDVAHRRCVDPNGAGQDDAAGLGAPGRLEDARRAEHIQRDAGAGIGVDHVDIGRSRQVKDRRRALEVLGERVGVENVGAPPLHIIAAGHDVIDHPHGVPGPPECVDDV